MSTGPVASCPPVYEAIASVCDACASGRLCAFQGFHAPHFVTRRTCRVPGVHRARRRARSCVRASRGRSPAAMSTTPWTWNAPYAKGWRSWPSAISPFRRRRSSVGCSRLWLLLHSSPTVHKCPLPFRLSGFFHAPVSFHIPPAIFLCPAPCLDGYAPVPLLSAVRCFNDLLALLIVA
jgi:hypothetical protein